MITYPDPKPELPTIDILILRDLDDRHQTTALSIAKRLGEHHSNVTTWLEKFAKQGLAGRYETHDGHARFNNVFYTPVHDRIAEYLAAKKIKNT